MRDQVRISVSGGEPKDLARGTSTIAEEAVDQLQENEKLVAGELCLQSLSKKGFSQLPGVAGGNVP